jgi:O-glycosyl hydrolase
MWGGVARWTVYLAVALLFPTIGQATPALAASATVGSSVSSPPSATLPAKGLPDNGARLAPTDPSPAIPVGDEIVTSGGDASGWHVYAASAGDGWMWHPLASLLPGGNGDQGWIGQQCLTGDGRYVAAVVAPYHAANEQAGMNRGAMAYIIDAHNGNARPLARGVSLSYFNPGCGTDSKVTLTSYPATDYSQTRVTVFEAATGNVLRTVTVKGQVTSAISVGDAIFGAYNKQLLRLIGPSVQSIATLPGTVFDLRAATDGIDFLTTREGLVEVWKLRQGKVQRVGNGKQSEVSLFSGAAGRNFVSGASALTADAGLRALGGTLSVGVEAVSLGGTKLLLKQPRASGRLGTNSAAALLDSTSKAVVTQALPAPGRQRITVVPAMDAGVRAIGSRVTTANTTNPTCAVPRNDLWNQVRQPRSSQVDWAIQMGARGWLVSGNIPARPSEIQNYRVNDTTSLFSYYPDADFPPPAISGYANAAVPPQVLYGIFAAESNWNQASWHAVSGYGGNPLIANYYGSTDPANPTDINYDVAECGYGIGQITDIMKKTSTGVTPNQQVAVAVDYAENVSVAIQVLVGKWNQLASLGDSMNNGDPTILENWYGAIWAYNSGVHMGDPGYGLGWFNNPDNTQWDPNRPPFLRTSYNDANNPSRWPYQERVFGWMETPQSDPNGGNRYTGTSQRLNIPPFRTFCSLTINSCNPNAVYPNDPCPNENYTCYWNRPATWVSCVGTTCSSEVFTITSQTTPEPNSTSRNQSCASTTGLPGGLPSGSQLVADTFLSSQNTTYLDPNVIGCSTTPPVAGWTRSGAFELDNHSGTPLGVSDTANLDLHQLGTGFYGHTWFSHTRNDTANDVIGKWSPSLPSAGLYDIQAFIPSPGATTTYAPYEIWSSPAAPYPDVKVINQNLYSNEWVDLGKHPLMPGATVKLHSAVSPYDGGDIAYSAVLFIPVMADHSQSVDTGTASSYSPYNFKGWGTSLAWWANVVGGWSASDRQTVEQQLFLPADASTYGNYRLGLNVVRYNIGGSPVGSLPQNCPALRTGAQVPSPKQSATSPINLANDPRQVTILDEADTTITGAGVVPHYEAFANSPPWWMTISGCPSGNATSPLYFPADNLSSSQYQAYADYLAGVVNGFATAGHRIVFDSVEPFNEPASGFGWPNTGQPQEGANFATSSQDTFFTPLCGESFGATQISAPDENTIPEANSDWSSAYSAAHRSCLSQINAHGYNAASRGALRSTALANSKRLWMSEFGNGGSDLNAALVTSQQIAADLQYLRPEVWVYWQAVEQPGGWGLLQSSPGFVSPVTATPRYWAVAQYSQFIRPNYTVYRVHDAAVDDSSEQSLVYTVAASDPTTGKVVIVTNNPSPNDSSINLDLSSLGITSSYSAAVYQTSPNGWLIHGGAPYLNGSVLQAYQPAQSITTYVLIPPGGHLAPTRPKASPRVSQHQPAAGLSGGQWTNPAESLFFDGRLLPISGSCVRYQSGSCLDQLGRVRPYGVICNVTGPLGKPEIDIWINGLQGFRISESAVIWVRGKEDEISAPGVSQFDPTGGVQLRSTLDGHSLSGSVRC